MLKIGGQRTFMEDRMRFFFKKKKNFHLKISTGNNVTQLLNVLLQDA